LLFNAEIEDTGLSVVRDVFIFQCFIGCRYGDLMRLKRSNIINGCIQYIASKTRSEKPRVARVPVTEKAMVILSRYDLSDGRLLPFITLRHYNKFLKKLFLLVDLTRIVTLADKKTQIDIQVPICDLASSHMARRVFIGGLHKKNVKNEIIASMSGHVENSKAFSRYYDIDQEDQEQAMGLIQ
jgi:integrase